MEKILDEYHLNVSQAVKKYKFYKGVPLNETDLQFGWSFSSALLFTVSVVTTIGKVYFIFRKNRVVITVFSLSKKQ